MTDYEYEIKQKKDIARNAKYKNRKHRGCSLPSDNLTAAQKRRLNGKMIELDTTKRIVWKELKEYPVRLWADYLNNLIRRFDCNYGQLRYVIDVSDGQFWNIRKKIKEETGSDILKPKHKRGVYQMPKEIQDEYRVFVGLSEPSNKDIAEENKKVMNEISATCNSPEEVLERLGFIESPVKKHTPPFYTVASRNTIICEEDLSKLDSEIIAKDFAKTIELYTKNITNSDKKVLISFTIKRVSKDYSIEYSD